MPTYFCKIGTADGRVLDKEFEAGNSDLLRESLEDQGFYVFQVRRRFLHSFLNRSPIGSHWNSRRFLAFNQELLVLMRSGLPILQVFDTLLDRQDSSNVLEVLREIREDIRGGSSLSDAFGKFPRYFPHLYIASIKAGERTGDLPVTLSRFITYQKRVEAIKAKIKNAAFYPSLLTIAVVAVVLFLMLYVVPRFTQIYADANVQLPLMTRVLVASAKGLTQGLPLWLPLVLVSVAVGRIWLKSERGGMLFDRLKLRIPFIGPLLIEYALLSFSRTLGTTIASGIPIVTSLQMARGTLNNRILESRMVLATRRIEEGSKLADAFEQTGFFPKIALRMIAVGETSSSLADMLTDVADYYESEVEQRLDRLTALIEPIMMASMGLLIGGIVIAMYFPIFQLGATIQ
jgi:type IV pilus assembly protein PilC